MKPMDPSHVDPPSGGRTSLELSRVDPPRGVPTSLDLSRVNSPVWTPPCGVPTSLDLSRVDPPCGVPVSLDPYHVDPPSGVTSSSEPPKPTVVNGSPAKKLPVKLREKGLCKVCGDTATGMYFGALVCVPCKTFYLRYAGDNFAFRCKRDKGCEIVTATRTQCKYCRYQKCLQVGMTRKERPAHVQLRDGQQQCMVCLDLANGVHFGAVTCEGCKKFFRRGLTEHESYQCKLDKTCPINPRTRNACRYCRYQKCIGAGMSREAIQMGRPSKVRPSDSGSIDPSSNNSNGATDAACANNGAPRLEGNLGDNNPRGRHFSGSSSDSKSHGYSESIGGGSSPDDGYNPKRSSNQLGGSIGRMRTPACGKEPQRATELAQSIVLMQNGVVSNYMDTAQKRGPLQDLPMTSSFDLTPNDVGRINYFHGGSTLSPTIPMSGNIFCCDIPIKTECEDLPSPSGSDVESLIIEFEDRNGQISVELGANLQPVAHADNMSSAYHNVEVMTQGIVKSEHSNSCRMPGQIHRPFNGIIVNSGYDNVPMQVMPQSGKMFDDKNGAYRTQVANGSEFSVHASVLPAIGFEKRQRMQDDFALQNFRQHNDLGTFGTVPEAKRRRVSAPPSHLQTQEECHVIGGYDQLRRPPMSPAHRLPPSHLTPPSPLMHNSPQPQTPSPHLQPTPPLSQTPFPQQTPPLVVVHHSPGSLPPTPPSRPRGATTGLASYHPQQQQQPLQHPLPQLQAQMHQEQPLQQHLQQQPRFSVQPHNQAWPSTEPYPTKHPMPDRQQQHCEQQKQLREQQLRDQQLREQQQRCEQQKQLREQQQRCEQQKQLREQQQRCEQQKQLREQQQRCEQQKQRQLEQQQRQGEQQQQLLEQQKQQQQQKAQAAISRLVDPTNSAVSGGLVVAQQLTQEIISAYQDDAATAENPGTPVVSSNEGAHVDVDVSFVAGYWVEPGLPDENVFFSDTHRWIIDLIMKAYNKFVETGTKIIKQINSEFQAWEKENPDVDPNEVPPEFLRIKLVRLYTLSSVNYCESLPGFRELHDADQYTILRFGQSQSRILVAAQHWYDPELDEFHNFYPWKPKSPRPDFKFRQDVLVYSRTMRSLDMDQIEASLLNALVLIAADFPDLRNCGLIEEKRAEVLKAFRAYTTVKYGTPNTRIEELFQHIPKLRAIGLYHHRMTFSMPYVTDSEHEDEEPDS